MALAFFDELTRSMPDEAVRQAVEPAKETISTAAVGGERGVLTWLPGALTCGSGAFLNAPQRLIRASAGPHMHDPARIASAINA